MFLSTPLSLNFLILFLASNLIDGVSAKTKTADVVATTADLFNLAYPVLAYPVASVSLVWALLDIDVRKRTF